MAFQAMYSHSGLSKDRFNNLSLTRPLDEQRAMRSISELVFLKRSRIFTEVIEVTGNFQF